MEAEGDPRTALLERGVYSVNPRRELFWNILLEPGETKKLAYSYSVLVEF